MDSPQEPPLSCLVSCVPVDATSRRQIYFHDQNDESRRLTRRASIKSPATSRCINPEDLQHTTSISTCNTLQTSPYDHYTRAPDAPRCDLASPDLLS